MEATPKTLILKGLKSQSGYADVHWTFGNNVSWEKQVQRAAEFWWGLNAPPTELSEDEFLPFEATMTVANDHHELDVAQGCEFCYGDSESVAISIIGNAKGWFRLFNNKHAKNRKGAKKNTTKGGKS